MAKDVEKVSPPPVSPQSVPSKFDGFSKHTHTHDLGVCAHATPAAVADFACRLQIRVVDDTEIPGAAFSFQNQYAQLKMPVSIIAGKDDRLIDIDPQSRRLHDDISQIQ